MTRSFVEQGVKLPYKRTRNLNPLLYSPSYKNEPKENSKD